MSKNTNPYDNELMAAMRDEERFVTDNLRGQRMVKLERGQVWTVRFLPVRLGKRGTWFGRIARHWVNKKPIICPVGTDPAFGGNKDMECPCCHMSDEINRSGDEEISKFGWSVRANSQWLTFCTVLDKNGDEVTGNEMLMAYEFWHYVNTWEELKGFWKAACRGGKNLTSVLDYKTGNDFAVSRTAKGLRLDKLDSAPIFDPEDPNFDSYIKKIEASVKEPKVKIPTAKELEIFAGKIEEQAERLASGSSGSRRSARRVDDDELEGNKEEAPARPARRSPAPALPSRARMAPETDNGEDDSNPDLAPARSRRPATDSEESPRSAPTRRAPTPLAEEDEPVEEAPESAEDAPVRPHTTVPKRKPSALPPPEEAEDDPEPIPEVEESKTAAAPSRNGPKRASPIPSKNDRVEDDPEELPEETGDPAPPVKRSLNQAAETDEQAPPPVRRTGVGNALRDKIRQTDQRDE